MLFPSTLFDIKHRTVEHIGARRQQYERQEQQRAYHRIKKKNRQNGIARQRQLLENIIKAQQSR